MRLPSEFTAVVTGAGSGLGRALTLELARRGGRVVAADLRAEAAEQTAEEVRAAGGQAWSVACDVGSWEQVEALAKQAEELAGPIDLVANNAGVAVGGRIGEVPLEDWRWVVDVNLWGVVHGCRAFAPAMRERGRGWILNVASAAGFACLAQFGPYSMTKAGVIALSETLRAELEPHGVAVTVLCPSFFRTGIIDAARGADPEARALVEQMTDDARLSADDVARKGLKALERGHLHAVPMAHARAAWWAKRAFPGSFHRLTNFFRRRADRQFATEPEPTA